MDYAIEGYYLFARHKEDFYLSAFEGMGPFEIYEHLRQLGFLCTSDNDEEVKEFERYGHFYIYWGDQFDGDTLYLLYRDEVVNFIFHKHGKSKADRYEVPHPLFCQVFEQFVAFCFGSIEVMGERGYLRAKGWIEKERKPFLLREV